MLKERWGSFSLKDHISASNMVGDVLMYDRLVFPVPVSQEMRFVWRMGRWQPELQDKRLAQLKDRAIRIPWDDARRKQFGDAMTRAQALAQDTGTVLPGSTIYGMTRRVLAQQDVISLPKGVSKVHVVAAYQSVSDFQNSYLLDERRERQEGLCLVFRNRLAAPVFDKDAEKSLELAIQMSNEADFQKKRRALYDWQEKLLDEDLGLAQALDGLEYHINEYNKVVRAAEKRVLTNLCFTVAGASVGLVGAMLANPLVSIPAWMAAGSSALALARFLTLDRKPVLNAGESGVAAMFHDVESRFEKL